MTRINDRKPHPRKLPRLALLLILMGVAVICFLLVGVTAWFGGAWNFGLISVSNPRPRLALGVLALLLWYLAWVKERNRTLSWKSIASSLVILGMSLAIPLSLSEWAFRRHLQSSQGFGTLQMFREHEKGESITPRSRHPVSELITLTPNHKLIYELRPNMNKPYGDYHVYSNRDGLRESRDYESPKPAGIRRILGIGDSGMFGWDVPQEENYLATLECTLAKRPGRQSIEVLNGGVPGYNAQQEIEWLATKGLPFEPDIVVVGWCNNDYDAPFFIYQPVDFMQLEGSLIYRFLFQRKRFFADMKPNVSIYTSFEKSNLHPDVLEGMGEEGVRRVLTRLRELGAMHGFKFLVFGPMDDRAVAICRELDLPYFNTNEGIPAHSVPVEYKVHDMHPTIEGHAVLALHLERELDRLGWLGSLNL